MGQGLWNYTLGNLSLFNPKCSRNPPLKEKAASLEREPSMCSITALSPAPRRGARWALNANSYVMRSREDHGSARAPEHPGT